MGLGRKAAPDRATEMIWYNISPLSPPPHPPPSPLPPPSTLPHPPARVEDGRRGMGGGGARVEQGRGNSVTKTFRWSSINRRRSHSTQFRNQTKPFQKSFGKIKTMFGPRLGRPSATHFEYPSPIARSVCEVSCMIWPSRPLEGTAFSVHVR